MNSRSVPDRLMLCVILVCSLGFAFLLFQPNLEADWGPWDDHGLLEVLGPSHHASLGHALRAASAFEELAQPGVGFRYRPSFAFVQALEIWVFGDSLTAWYGTRILAFGLMLACGWFLLVQAAGPALGTCFALAVATRPFWGRIFACLGPGETFSAPGAVLAILGCYLAWRGIGWRRTGWTLYLLGGVLAIGCKENMFFLAAPGLVLAWVEWRRGRISLLAVAACSVVTAFAAFVTGAVVLATSRVGQDLYANPVGIAARLSVAVKGLATYWLIPLSLVLSLAGLAVAVLPRRLRMQWVLWELAIVCVFGIQLVFYNGKWESASRYAYPGEMLIALALFVPVMLIWQMRASIPSSWLRIAGGLLSAALLAICWHNIAYLRPIIKNNVEVTRVFSTTVRHAAELARQRPADPVVVYTRGLGEWEAVTSVSVYLRFLGVANPVVLRVDPHYRTGGWSPGLAAKINSDLVSLTEGGHGYAPASILTTAQGCIGMSGYGPAAEGSPCSFAGSLTQ